MSESTPSRNCPRHTATTAAGGSYTVPAPEAPAADIADKTKAAKESKAKNNQPGDASNA